MPSEGDIEMNSLAAKEDIMLAQHGSSSNHSMRREPVYDDNTSRGPSALRRWADSFRRDPGSRITPKEVPLYFDRERQQHDHDQDQDQHDQYYLPPPPLPPQVPMREHDGERYYDLHSATLATVNTGLSRELKGRHLQMIAIGGSIGTGLFVTSGKALSTGGPASVLLAYCIIGVMLYCTVHALGELAVVFPVAGSFSAFSTRFLDPSWGFAMGWNYALQWLVVLPLEIIAAAITIQYWDPNVKKAAFVAIFILAIGAINLFGVKGYGEAEFIFAIIKVTAVIGFILLGIVINVGGTRDEGYIGTKYWTNPGAFNNGFKGLCSVFVQAAFAFAGTELVGLAAAETANPRKSLPTAIKQVFWRITLFYVVALTVVGLLVPYDSPQLLASNVADTAASPFVIAIESAGIEVLPSVMNSVILIAVLSVGNSAVFGSSRTLAALADQGQAPRILSYVDRRGRPLFAILLSMSIGLIAFIADSSVQERLLDWLLAVSALSSVLTWGSICLSHIRFRRAWIKKGRSLGDLAFRAQPGLTGSWIGFLLNAVILVAQFWLGGWPLLAPTSEPQTSLDVAGEFFLQCMAIPIVLIMWLGHKLYFRTKFIRSDNMDIDTGRRDFNLPILMAQEYEEKRNWPRWKRIYRFFC